ncbi:MAG: DUF1674 domain-containing protein [Rhodospirillales bacterium]
MTENNRDDAPKPKEGTLKERPKAPPLAPVHNSGTEEKAATDLFEQPARADETGGPKGPEPTRFGDWEKKGRCIDF